MSKPSLPSRWFVNTLGLAIAIAIALAGCGDRQATSTNEPEPADEPGDESPPTETPAEPEGISSLVVGDAPCQQDADCVPDQCCHASACTGVARAPTCEETMCTMECRGGTLDCGGACLCHEGHCAARIASAPGDDVQ